MRGSSYNVIDTTTQYYSALCMGYKMARTTTLEFGCSFFSHNAQ